jgi:hypothetical protein
MEVGHLESLCCDFGMDSVLGQASGEIALEPLPRRGNLFTFRSKDLAGTLFYCGDVCL